MPQTIRSVSASLAFLLAPLAAQATCSSTVHAPGCGPSLAVTFAPNGPAGNNRIDITATELFPKSWGIMIWGDTPTQWAISPTCNLNVLFTWGHTFQVDAQGQFSWSRVWPASSTPGQYFIQIGSFDLDAAGNWTIVGTDAVRAQCQ
jgi:hypothetical protein